MDKISVGKLLPNLEVTEVVSDCSNVNDDSSSEESAGIVRRNLETLYNPKIYVNRFGGFTTGLDLLSEEQSGILDKRAERFGLVKEANPKATISSLYESMGIDVQKRHSSKIKNIRLNAAHVLGVNNLTTEDVFTYFQDYGPSHIEWIDDFCCNIVWFDEMSCARAIIGLSKPLPDIMKHLPEELKNINQTDEDPEITSLNPTDDQGKEAMEIDDFEEKPSIHKSVVIPVPPGYWRLANSHSKAKTILLRFATTDDKKIPGAEKRSEFYKEHGNPNYGGLKGLISSSKKIKTQAAANRWAVLNAQNPSTSKLQSESDVPKVPRQKKFRMRMYADDEELKIKKLRAKKIVPEVKHSVHSRLGSKYTKDDLCSLGTNREPILDRDTGEEVVDLRSKLKFLRSKRHRGEHSRPYVGDKNEVESQKYSHEYYDEEDESQKYSHEYYDDEEEDKEREEFNPKKFIRNDEIKNDPTRYYKRKHRSPSCQDSDSSE